MLNLKFFGWQHSISYRPQTASWHDAWSCSYICNCYIHCKYDNSFILCSLCKYSRTSLWIEFSISCFTCMLYHVVHYTFQITQVHSRLLTLLAIILEAMVRLFNQDLLSHSRLFEQPHRRTINSLVYSRKIKFELGQGQARRAQTYQQPHPRVVTITIAQKTPSLSSCYWTPNTGYRNIQKGSSPLGESFSC